MLEQLEWSALSIQSCKRLDHSATLLSGKTLLIYGGMDLEHVFQDGVVLSPHQLKSIEELKLSNDSAQFTSNTSSLVEIS
jgi:hypothetical protein